jgi:hypothetical protein
LKNYKFNALFMCLLILTLPFHSAFALGSILDVKVEGKDAVNGYISANTDFIKYTVTLNTNINPNNIKTNYPITTKFDNCNGDICYYTSQTLDREGKKQDYAISIHNDFGVPIETKSGTLYIDELSPTINSFETTQSNNKLNFEFDAYDTACSTCGTKGAGISTINILENNLIKWTIDVENNISVKMADSIDINELDITDDTSTICLQVIDAIGLISESECKEIAIDSQVPILLVDSLKLYDKTGYELLFVPNKAIDAIAKINIEESNLLDVYGDFSSLNTLTPENLINKKATCNLAGDYYTCEWKILVDKPQDNPIVYINVTDTNGNNELISKKIDISLDTNEVGINKVYIIPELIDENKVHLKQGENIVTVELLNSGAGYNKNDVYVDFHSFGGSSNTQANKCNLTANIWKCEIITSVSKNNNFEDLISITPTNDIGSSPYQPILINAIVDSNEPIITETSLSSDCAYASQGLTIDFTVEDDSDITLNANVSEIATVFDLLKGDCIGTTNNDYECSLVISNIITAHTFGNIKINITDAAGNTKIETLQIEICEEESNTVPNFVSVQVGTPSKVSKRLLSFLPTPTYIPLSFKTSGSATIMEKQVSCFDTKSSYFLNRDKNYPTLVAKINKQSIINETDEFNLSCTVNLIMRKGVKVYSTPEVETFNINVPLLDNALGDMSAATKAKIKTLEDEIKSSKEEIDELETYNGYLSMLCSIAETMGQINSILQSLKSVIWSVTCATWVACNAYPPTAEVCKQAPNTAWYGGCNTLGKFNYYVESYIWSTGLIGPPPFIGTIVKYSCMIYTCRLCDLSTFINIGISAASAALSPSTVETTNTGSKNDMITAAQKDPTFGNHKSDIIEINGVGYDSWTTSSEISYMDRWKGTAGKVDINHLSSGSNWKYDPYKSIHYANSCLCLPAIIYNMKKERQIKCMYKTCLEESAKFGLPADHCDNAKKQRECLYVDGAYFKKHGYLGMFDDIFETIFNMLPGIIIGIAYSATCPDYKFTSEGCTQTYSVGVCGNFRQAICGLSAAAAAITEIMDIMDGGLDFSKYEGSLEGQDYCGAD